MREKVIIGLAGRLGMAMYKKDISQAELARRAGVSKVAVNYWLTEKSAMNIVALRDVCTILGVSADYLLFGKEK